MEVRVPVGCKKIALIDAEDEARVKAYRWYPHTHGYAISRVDRRTAYMHRFILGAPSGSFIDHINGDKLDNRRANLRTATPSQNNQNCQHCRAKTGILGVYLCAKNGNPYRVAIWIKGRAIHIGYYPTLEEAAVVADKARREHYSHYVKMPLTPDSKRVSR